MPGQIGQKRPAPMAFCWYYGKELTRRIIDSKGCQDTEKQLAPTGKCKYLQIYGEIYNKTRPYRHSGEKI